MIPTLIKRRTRLESLCASSWARGIEWASGVFRRVVIYLNISVMKKKTLKHIKTLRLEGLPEEMRRTLKQARERRGWSQREMARRLGLTQTHISAIESGKIVPRYDTLLELVRTLDNDLLMVPRALVPVVQSLIRDQAKPEEGEGEERPLYADRDEERTEEPHDEV
jgi:transcriptional regulator with XRE-family HTH domain